MVVHEDASDLHWEPIFLICKVMKSIRSSMLALWTPPHGSRAPTGVHSLSAGRCETFTISTATGHSTQGYGALPSLHSDVMPLMFPARNASKACLIISTEVAIG